MKVTLEGLAGAVYGSAIGVVHGAFYGAVAGDTAEGVVIGAIAGSVIGVVLDACEPFDKQAQSVRRCLSGKGYVLGVRSF